MASNKLGRGFEALISDMREMQSDKEVQTYDAGGALTEGVIEVDITSVHRNPRQPRKIFDEQALAELSASVARYGVLQPLIVAQKQGGYQIIAGERRFRAAKMAGLAKVPVIVKDVSEEQIREIALIENLQRENLNPIEEAEALYTLLKENGLTQEGLAKVLGKSRPAVANSLRLLTLARQVQLLVRDGSLSVGHAKVLLALKDIPSQIALANKAAKDGISVRELEELVAKRNGTKAKNAAAKKAAQSLELKAMADDMQRLLGTKVKVNGNDKRGKIVIDYYTADDLQRIYEMLDGTK